MQIGMMQPEFSNVQLVVRKGPLLQIEYPVHPGVAIMLRNTLPETVRECPIKLDNPQIWIQKLRPVFGLPA
jgi:hypothetical protein